MTSELDLRGVYVPLVTPFTESDAVAYDELEGLAAGALDAGAAGLVALGTTGEPATLDEDEKKQVVRVIADVCKDRGAHFSVGAGTNSTRASVNAVAAACEAGAQSILSVVPYYTRPSEAGIVSHFETLAATSDVPLIVYNIPARSGRGLGAASLLQLAAVDNIAGLKQAVGAIDADTLRLMADKPDNFHVLCGDDAYNYSLMTLGGSGIISASANLCTDGFVALIDAALKGEHEQALRLHNTLLPLGTVMFDEPSPAVAKALLHATGRISTPNLRAPMTRASARITSTATDIHRAVCDVLASL